MKKIICLCILSTLFFYACNTNPKETNNTIAEKSNEVKQENKSATKINNKNTTKKTQIVNKKQEVVGSGKINWKTIAEVEQLMKTEPKKVLVDAYTSWCGWCKRMDKNTFQHPEIAQYVNDNFYAIKFDAETKETINFKGKEFNFVPGGRKGHNELAKFLLKGRLSYPTISFLNEELDLINAFPGYKQPSDFDALLNYIQKNEFSNMGFTQFKSAFTSAIPPIAKNNVRSTLKKPTPQKRNLQQKPVLQQRVKVQPGNNNNNNIGIKNIQQSTKQIKAKPKAKAGN